MDGNAGKDPDAGAKLADGCDGSAAYSSDPESLPGYAAWKQQWDQGNAAARYETDKPLWDLMSQLPEITDVFIGTTHGARLVAPGSNSCLRPGRDPVFKLSRLGCEAR